MCLFFLFACLHGYFWNLLTYVWPWNFAPRRFLRQKKNRVIEKNRNFFSKFFRNLLKNVWRKEFRLQNFSFTLFFFRNFFRTKYELLLHKKSSFLLSIISQTYEARNHKINHLHEHERMLGKQISDYDKKKSTLQKLKKLNFWTLKKKSG